MLKNSASQRIEVWIALCNVIVAKGRQRLAFQYRECKRFSSCRRKPFFVTAQSLSHPSNAGKLATRAVSLRKDASILVHI